MGVKTATKASTNTGAKVVGQHSQPQASQYIPSGPYADVLALQRSAGNRAVTQLLEAESGNGPLAGNVQEDNRTPTNKKVPPLSSANASATDAKFSHVRNRNNRAYEAPLLGGIVQRKCACGSADGMSGECKECSHKKLQTKLKVNGPGDIYEQEADRIAKQVLATPVPPAVSGAPLRIQRFAVHPTGQAEAAPASVDQALASPGRPLEPTLRQDMEQRFGYDFSRVRVHSGVAAVRSAGDVNASAYTVGHDIVFGAGGYTPETREGRWLLAHELTHVAQQSAFDGLRLDQGDTNRGLSPLASIAAIPQGAGGTIQRQESEATGATRAASPDPMWWHQIVGERSTHVGKMARVRGQPGLRLYSRPTHSASNEVILPFDELVQVERKTDYGWCWAIAMGQHTGKSGFLEGQFLSFDPPEPSAHLYRVKAGDTLSTIAARYYGKSMDDENNVRLYVQALYLANQGHAGVYLDKVDLSLSETLLRSGREEEALKLYKGAKVRKGLAIWVPSENFIAQLKAQGLVTSGSTEVMKVWRRAKEVVKDVYEGAKYVAGFIVGMLEGAWDAIVDLFKGAAEMIETVAKALYHVFTGNPGAIKDMLMGWVEKLKLAWKNRGVIAYDFMRKWEAKDGWDRGRFQGEVCGWIMMTAMIVFLTAGEGAIPQIAGKWASVVRVLKTVDALGDVMTYARKGASLAGKAASLAGKATRIVSSKLGRGARRAERIAEDVADEVEEAAGKTVKQSQKATQVIEVEEASSAAGSKSPTPAPTKGGTPRVDPAAGIDDATRRFFESNAGKQLKVSLDASPHATQALKACHSPCRYPKFANSKQVKRIEKILADAEKSGMQIDYARLQQRLHNPAIKNAKDLDEAIDALKLAFENQKHLGADIASKGQRGPSGSYYDDTPAATRLRNSPGVASGGKNLITFGENWLQKGKVGLFPKQIADRMRGMNFNNFGEFRETFWRLVASDPALSRGWSPQNLTRMSNNGWAPFVSQAERVGGGSNRVWQLDHKLALKNGGAVYDFDNLQIVSPAFHGAVGER